MSDRTTNNIMIIIVIIIDISSATIKTTFVMLENFAAFDYNIVLMTQACVRHDQYNKDYCSKHFFLNIVLIVKMPTF